MNDDTRLRKEITASEKESDLLHDKLSRLEKDRIIKTDTVVLFQLDQEITETQKAFNDVENQLNIFRHHLSENIQVIEFVNRLNEISFVTNIHCPHYLLISAPTGYGKSRLLDAVEIELSKQNWFCANIKLPQEQQEQPLSFDDVVAIISQHITGVSLQSKMPPEKMAQDTGRCLLQKSQMNIALLIDGAESLNKNAINDIINRYILIIQKILGTAKKNLRVIFSGRYISDWAQIGDVNIPLTPMALTSFDFSAVQQTVDRFDANQNLRTLEEYRREFAAYLMYFTGGHPRCMAEILSSDFNLTIDANEEEYYHTFVKPVINEITANIPDDLKEIFDALSVVRRFNACLLRQLLDTNLIQWSQRDKKDAYKLEKALQKTYLVEKKNGFLQDDITRRMLAIHLRRTDLTHYLAICETAIAFYESELRAKKSHNPITLAIEWLFQKLQLLFYKEHGTKTQFVGYLAEMLDILAEVGYDRDGIEAFQEQLHNDWEFRFMFNYLLREGVYDNDRPFQELIEQIVNFTKGLQGGKHHA